MKRLIRRISWIVVGCAALTFGACASGLAVLTWLQPDTVALPAPTGSYPVGRVFQDWTDNGRLDPLAPSDGVARALPVWIWYPAAQAESASRADYLPGPLVEALDAEAAPLLARTVGRLMTHPSRVRSHALDAPAVAHGRFPVLLMRPMRGGLAAQYADIAEDLASHGYIVVGADIPYTTRVAMYADGRVVRRTAAGAPPELEPGRVDARAPGLPNDRFLPVLDVLTDDGKFLLDRLERLNAENAHFAGRLDLDSVGVFGHSVGGTAALELCAVEPRCRAAVDIDGYIMGTVVETGLAKPFLFLASDRPLFRRPATDLREDERAFLDAWARLRLGLPNRVQHVVIEGSRHFNFIDSALLTSRPLGRATGSLGPIDPERALELTRAAVRRFFDVYLKEASEESLLALAKDYPEIRME